MSSFLAELIGTAMIILLGDGVVANVVLNKTKGQSSGWIVITMGWAMAVFVGVFCTAKYSGAHLNPAVTIALATVGKFAWAKVPAYIVAQLLGAMLGATLVWLSYKQHFEQTDDADGKLAVFCTAPAIRSKGHNLLTEIIGTLVLILGVLYIVAPANSLGALDALPVAFLVLGIGLSLGGPTGYAINPARDLGPRIMHFLLPIPQKRNSDWGYAWVPIIGPIAGALLAAVIWNALQ
ncbi:aquaporin family protein [Chitinophaga pendula]|uniref:MIP/aquaporin family protein n=1 Tax=Chitinophaga TaxID=79328 RepID=UPI000BAF5A83|nr:MULTISPECIES: MIP/aquaporin family protein [Chitinophaga]ASZ11374.1 aquaporin [Chitinophaga sp. MD30]UCJ05622.1 aquaporin family protein [Chitinophaga pendula]